MPLKFEAISDPHSEIIELIAELNPENPFSTSNYVEVRKRVGSIPHAFILKDKSGVVSGCLSYLTVGRLNSRVEVTSMPAVQDKALFWSGMFGFCRDHSISFLSVHTFASLETTIDQTEEPTKLKNRREYRLDLTVPDLWNVMNRRHHRLVKKARYADLEIRSASDTRARELHVRLANSSLDRRKTKGEYIDSSITLIEVNAFIDCGAGEIIQAVNGDDVFSSILIARSRTGAYAQSSGTSEAGRTMGSSHFLFHEVACRLKSEGLQVFNLGGAEENNVGLREFKLGLGSVEVPLQSAEFYTGSQFKKLATRAGALLKIFPSLPFRD